MNLMKESKIQFDWEEFRQIYGKLSKTEEVVIKQHFNVWIQEGMDGDDCYSSPELQGMYDQFKSSWIMCQMFTE